MKNTIKVVVADDNEIIRQMILDSISDEPEIEIVGEASNGKTAIDIITETKPDAVLLDLVMPETDGIGVMEAIRENHEFANGKPYFIIVSAAGKEDIISQALQTGAAYFFMKPFDGRILVKRIKQICNGAIKTEPNIVGTPEESTEEKLENEVVTLLHNLGVSVRMVGYKYLRDAIKMAINDSESLMSVTKSIYPEVADIYDTSSGNVERNIRYVVEAMWNRREEKMDSEVFKSMFGISEKKPTNSEFILLCSEHIKYKK